MNEAAPPEQTASRRHRTRFRWKRWLIALVVAGLFALLTIEVTLRVRYGLGNPVVYTPHPTIEYVLEPNQSGHRLGNRYLVNRYGMRSDDFPPTKTDEDETRVLVLGDSVLFGGSQTNQFDLPTEVARRALSAETEGPVVVGNAAVGSWGPPNQLAYLEEHGPLDADVVVLVLSSHDARDSPDFIPVGRWPVERPSRKPLLALTEAWARMVAPRFDGWIGAGDDRPAGVPEQAWDPEVAMAALDEIALWCADRDLPLSVVLFQNRAELNGHDDPGFAMLKAWHTEQRAAGRVVGPPFETAEAFRALHGSGFRDDWHPDVEGSHIIGEQIAEATRAALAFEPRSVPETR